MVNFNKAQNHINCSTKTLEQRKQSVLVSVDFSAHLEGESDKPFEKEGIKKIVLNN